MNPLEQVQAPLDFFSAFFQIAIKWTPKAIVAGLAGYYSLGIAYDRGVMAAIDRIAIRMLRPSMGYLGLAAFMPTFQWYSAWGVRCAVAIGAGLFYDLVERILRATLHAIPFNKNEEPFLTPGPSRSST